jgi:hypothetical protein
MKKTLFLTTILILFYYLFANAQTHEVGASAGMMNYKGELATSGNLAYPKMGFGAFYRINTTRASSWNFQIIYGQIGQDDNNSSDLLAKTRNHKFETELFEFSTQWEYNFLNFRNKGNRLSERKQNFTPYFFCGLGYLQFTQKFNQNPNYNTRSIIIPLGIGIKYALTENLNLGLAIGARATFTDQLDDMGVQVSQGANTIRNPKYYTNGGGNDQYYFSHLTLSYVFGDKGKECPIK